jgi:dTMP kinase
MNKQLFIVFEGIDGCGKSTQVKLLEQQLKLNNNLVYTTYEPTDSLIGATIRNTFKGRLTYDQQTIAALNVADRLDHLHNSINGLLKKKQEGYSIISDRYYLSSYAYHGVYVDMDWVIAANALSVAAMKPDLHLFIDVDPNESMRRLQKRALVEMYEQKDHLEKVRDKYFQAFEKTKNTEHIVIIDGNGSIEHTSRSIWKAVEALL